MTTTTTSTTKRLPLWLLGLLVGLMLVHLTLAVRTAQLPAWHPDASFRLWSQAALLWLTTGVLLYSGRHRFAWHSQLGDKVMGSLLLVGVLGASKEWSSAEWLLRSFPLLSVVGVALLSLGYQQLRCCWRELLVLSFLLPSQALIEALAELGHLPTLTAYGATALLWCLGLPVWYHEAQVLLPHGGVYVSSECAGVGSMFHLLGLSALYLVTFPTRRVERWVLPLVALLLAFSINVVRVASLALLSAFASPKTFDYWHQGSGSHLNSVVSVLLLSLVCLVLQQPQAVKKQ